MITYVIYFENGRKIQINVLKWNKYFNSKNGVIFQWSGTMYSSQIKTLDLDIFDF